MSGTKSALISFENVDLPDPLAPNADELALFDGESQFGKYLGFACVGKGNVGKGNHGLATLRLILLRSNKVGNRLVDNQRQNCVEQTLQQVERNEDGDDHCRYRFEGNAQPHRGNDEVTHNSGSQCSDDAEHKPPMAAG